MTDYNEIPDARLEPQKPVRSVDALALRDNPIAITEGSAGAPKIQTAAIADSAITYAKMAAWYTTASAVGTYAFLGYNDVNKATVTFGNTLAGSNLCPAGILTQNNNDFADTYPAISTAHAGQNAVGSGTWQCLGVCRNAAQGAGATLWQRIA